jgi:NlpC/P60 family putative phage cell wall peptidase
MTTLGTRYHHQAALKGVGCDCIGLIAGVAGACGVHEAQAFYVDWEIAGYGRQPDPAMLLRSCDKYMDRKLGLIPEGGDIVIMRFEQEPQHFGIATDAEPMTLIHSLAAARKVVEHRLDYLWRSRIVRVYAFRGLE